MKRVAGIVLPVGLAILAPFGSAAAQTGDGIEIVTVTAAKREQNVQDVPISMNVIGATQLNKFNAASLTNLMASVPSLMLQKSQTNVGLFMRGFGTTPANPASDMAVSVYQDGIWQEKSRNLMIDFFDVARIEVLRGAQGALVGKNTEVGAISIVSNDPTDTFEGSATVNYNFDFKGVDTYGYVSGPVTDTLSARLAVKFVDQSGYIKNLAYNTNEPDLSKYQGRLSLKFQPQEGITDVFKIEYSAWNQFGNTQLAGNPALPLSTSLKVACCTKTDSGPLGRHTYDRQHGWRMSNKLDFELGDGFTLTSLSGFTAYNSDSLGAGAASDPSGFATDFIEKYEGGSTELRLTSPSGDEYPVDYIVGAYVDYSRYRFLNPVDYAANVAFLAGVAGSPGFGAQLPTAGGLTLDDTENTFSYSVYASATWHVIDHLRLIGNLRYTRSSKSAVYKQFQRYGTRTASTGGVLGQPLFAGLISTRTGNNGANFFDPSITLQYDVTDDIMAYASWAKGSKGAAFDFPNRIINVSQFVFKPETSTSWEVGVKSNWFDNMVTFNLAGFWMKLKNMQVAGFDTTFNTLITKNAGEAESKGVEMALNIRPLEGLSIDNNVNYLDTRYTDFPGAACLPVAPAAFTSPYGYVGCTTATNNLKGVPLQFVPQWSGNTSIDYTTPVFDGLKLDVTGSVEWRGPIWLAPTYVLPYGKHNGMSKFNLRVAVGAEDDAWTLAVVGKNLTNTLTTNSSQTFWGGLETGKASEIEIFLDEPRNISLQASIRF